MEINNSFGFMLPKRNAMAVISNDALRFHMIPDRSKYNTIFKFYLKKKILNISFRNFSRYVFGDSFSVL